jgi:uracil-DNA glycosylase family 4
MAAPVVPPRCSYRQLVTLRKQCSACSPALQNPASIEAGALDSLEIGPYTRWQGSQKASIVVVGQDFADVRAFIRNRGTPGAAIPTNQALVELFESVGIKLPLPNSNTQDERLFFTNAVLCLKGTKRVGMQGGLDPTHFENCRAFLKRTIALVRPKVIVALGQEALNSTWRAFRSDPAPPLGLAVGQLHCLTQRMHLLPVYHPGRRNQNMFRSFPEMLADWQPLSPFVSHET